MLNINVHLRILLNPTDCAWMTSMYCATTIFAKNSYYRQLMVQNTTPRPPCTSRYLCWIPSDDWYSTTRTRVVRNGNKPRKPLAKYTGVQPVHETQEERYLHQTLHRRLGQHAKIHEEHLDKFTRESAT